MKLSLMRTATGKEDPELPLLQRINSLELPASEIAAQTNASQSSRNSHQLFRGDCVKSGLHVKLLQKKPLLNNSNKNRLAWAKKHERWTLDWWKSVLWSDESKYEIFGSNRCLFEMQSR